MGGKKESEKKRRTHTFAASPSLPPPVSVFLPPSLTHPLTPDFLLLMSPPLPPSCPRSVLLPPPPIPLSSSLSLSLPCLPLPLPPPPPRLSSTAEVNTTRRQVNTPFFFSFFSPVLNPLGREREKDRGCVNTAITALRKRRWR